MSLHDWPDFLERHAAAWDRARTSAAGRRVLLATGMGGYNHGMVVEAALAVALTLRGARVEFLLCDGDLPACQLIKIDGAPPDQLLRAPATPRCPQCRSAGFALTDRLGLPVHRYGDFLDDRDRALARAVATRLDPSAVPEFTFGGCRVGEHAFAGACRYVAREDLDGEPEGPAILRRYAEAGMLAVLAVGGLLDQRAFDVACFHHGLYVPQGVVGEACRLRGVRVVTWNPAYRRQSFIFSHGDTYHRTMVTEDPATWEGLDLTAPRRRRLDDYLASRRSGAGDWIWFNRPSGEAPPDPVAAVGLDPAKPLVTALTSVVWDARLHYRSNAFARMLDWLEATVIHVAGRDDLQLAIRVHPAEVTGFIPSRQPVAEELFRRFPTLPPNVAVIGPRDPVDSYQLVERSDAVLIYNTKMGIEAACQGRPVVVAGEAWIRGKGFSHDASSPGGYEAILRDLPFRRELPAPLRERARRYAYHFFFRRMLRLGFLDMGTDNRLRLTAEELAALGPGGDPVLEAICTGILEGDPFLHEGA